jgi:hypothetical protein
MPTFELNHTAETPSAAIINKSNRTATVTDAMGRVITIRRIMPSARQRLRAIAGPELSCNEQWLGEAVLTFAVTAINGDPVVTNSMREIEFLSDQLDDAGLTAVAAGYVRHFGSVNEVGSIETIKN